MTQMQEPSALGRVVDLVRDLRARCPWDAAQTLETLRPYLVEEALELDQALRAGIDADIMSELGDLMLHVAWQIVLAEERGSFGAESVTRAIEEKMWRRHPHLYGDAPKPESWEKLKLDEHHHRRSALDGLPRRLPPLLMAFRLQERAAGVGFDWSDARGPREKVDEELRELDAELATPEATDRIAHEIGDLMFAVVNLSRKLTVDPRTALESANDRFSARFRMVERLATERGVEIGKADLDELDTLWDEAKRLEAETH